MTDRVVVLGAAGGFGRVFSRLLLGAGAQVVGVDRDSGDDDLGHPMLRADATSGSDDVLDAVACSDVVIACLPDDVAMASIDTLHQFLPEGALVVDTTSVKSPVAAWAMTARADLELLSLNPLFAPDLPFPGRRIAAVPLRPGPRTVQFLALVEQAGATAVEISADDHDREAAFTQALVHVAVLAVGRCLASHPYPPPFRLITPPFHLLSLLVGRVVGGDPEVYRRIQDGNPYAPAARRALGDALDAVEQTLDSPARYAELYHGVRSGLERTLPRNRAASVELFRRITTAGE